MTYPPIRKEPGSFALQPNMPDYQECRSSFTWDSVRSELDGLAGGNGLIKRGAWREDPTAPDPP